MALKLFSKTQKVEEKKSSIPLGVVGFTGANRAYWSGRSAYSLTRTGFLNNPIVFRCVKLIAETSAAMDIELRVDGVKHEIHPLMKLIDRPNRQQTRTSFLNELYGQLILTGNGYVEALFSDDGTISAMYVLRSDRVTAVPGKDGWPIAYDYEVGKEKYRYSLSEEIPSILHIKSFHPHDDHYGLSPLMAAANAIDVHNSASQWSKALLDNAARPSGAIVYKGIDGDGTMTNEQYSRLVEEIESNHQGARNAGRPMLLEGGLDWKPMGFSPSDMEFHKTKDAAARDIALALGVPPMILGIPGDNTYSNYQEANRAFYRSTVIPIVRNVLSQISNWLADNEIELVIDTNKIPSLNTERDAEWRRISESSFLTDAEKRKLLGFSEYPE